MRLGPILLPTQVLRRRRGYQRQELLRADLQRTIARFGYAIAPASLTPEALARLADLHEEVAAAAPPDEDRFTPLNVWRSADLDDGLRRRALEVMRAEVGPALAALAVPGSHVSPTVFQSKPSSLESAVDAHQDAILVDERADFGLYAWIPLTDVDERNGTLYVVPGSHRYALWPRLPSTGAELEHLRSAIVRHARVLHLSAGQVVLFDQATWHGSLPNRSGARRVAVGAVIRPADRPAYLAEATSETPRGHLELYRYPRSASSLTEAEQRDAREHLGRRRCAQVTAGPRSFALTCALERVLRPGAPGSRAPG